MYEIINKEKRTKREKLKKEYNLMLQRTKGLLPKKTQLILKMFFSTNESPKVIILASYILFYFI